MKLTEEQQAVYDTLTDEEKRSYDELFAEVDRIESLPLEDKVEMLMQRVGELIVIVNKHQREFEALANIFDIMLPNLRAATMRMPNQPTTPSAGQMPGQYL